MEIGAEEEPLRQQRDATEADAPGPRLRGRRPPNRTRPLHRSPHPDMEEVDYPSAALEEGSSIRAVRVRPPPDSDDDRIPWEERPVVVLVSDPLDSGRAAYARLCTAHPRLPLMLSYFRVLLLCSWPHLRNAAAPTLGDLARAVFGTLAAAERFRRCFAVGVAYGATLV